jgi:hypothetical protein
MKSGSFHAKMSEKDSKTSKKVVDLKALVAEIEAGKLTKKQAAESIGKTYAHFCVMLSRAGLIDRVRTRRAAAKYDTDAMKTAVNEAVSTLEKTALSDIARKHGIPDAQYAAFAMRVLHIKRSRMKADILHGQTQDSGAAAGG